MACTAGVGLLTLMPAAIFLSVRAQAGSFDDTFYSVQVNDRFRICFRWTERDVEDVEIVDCR